MTTKTLSGKVVRALARALALLLFCTPHLCRVVDALRAPPHLSGPKTVGGLPVHRTLLRKEAAQKDPSATKPTTTPYCFSLSSILDLPSRSNFLATQVWPSARVAAITLEERLWFGRGSNSDRDGNDNDNDNDKQRSNGIDSGSDNGSGSGSGSGERSLWNLSNREEQPFTICELGCGPGLPSIAAAAAAAAESSSSLPSSTICGFPVRVIATDVDSFGLELVDAAANEQGLRDILITRRVDLIEAGTDSFWADPENDWIRNDVDLFVLSDVFECEAVAVGAAQLTKRVLSGAGDGTAAAAAAGRAGGDGDGDKNDDDYANGGRRRAPKQKSVWVFAQTDRVQREVYLRELRRLLGADSNNDNDNDKEGARELRWSSPDSYTLEDSLWLCDVDETLVKYG